MGIKIITFCGGLMVSLMAATASYAATIVTGLDGSQGWEKSDVRPGGTVDIVDLAGAGGNLEANQPLPSGAVRLTTDDTDAAKAEIRIRDGFGIVGDILDSDFGLSYTWFDTGGSVAAPTIKLEFFGTSTSGDGYGQLIYEPYAQGADESTYITPTTGEWVTSAIDLDNGRFWNTGMFGVGSSFAGPPNRTLSEWLNEFDSDFSAASLIGLSVGIGTFNPSETGYFDMVSISGTAADEQWDFEVGSTSVVPLPGGLPLLLTGLSAIVLIRSRAKS